MSFLDVTYEFTYQCSNKDHNHTFNVLACKESEEMKCPECGAACTRLGFRSVDYKVRSLFQDEQNGRIYYKSRDGSGVESRMAKSKKDYMEKGITRNAYSKSYEEHLKAQSNASVSPLTKGMDV